MGVAVYQLSKTTRPIIFLIFCLFFLYMSFYGRNFKILLFCPSLLMLMVIIDNYINTKIYEVFTRLQNIFTIMLTKDTKCITKIT